MAEKRQKPVYDVVNAVLRDIGYSRLDEGIYSATWATADVEHYVYVFKAPGKTTILTADFGVKNRIAESFACDSIHRYGGELLRTLKCDEPTGCMMRFSFARVDRSSWPIDLPVLPVAWRRVPK